MPPQKARKPPSGKPLNREATLRHWRELLASGLTLNQYAWQNKVYRSELILGVIKHLPREWAEFKDKIGPIAERSCAHCGRNFYPNIGRQKFCSYACREQAWLAVPEHAQQNRDKANRWRAARRRGVNPGSAGLPPR